MEINDLLTQLNQIETLQVQLQPDGQFLRIENELPGFFLLLDTNKVAEMNWVVSPFGEDCLQFFMEEGGMLILTPNDYVFDVQQDGFVQVENLPPICSVRELRMAYEDYRETPMPSLNYDENLGLFHLHLYIFRSAMAHGIDVPMYAELLNIGKENGIWMQGN
jgi:hypothetical protein